MAHPLKIVLVIGAALLVLLTTCSRLAPTGRPTGLTAESMATTSAIGSAAGTPEVLIAQLPALPTVTPDLAMPAAAGADVSPPLTPEPPTLTPDLIQAAATIDAYMQEISGGGLFSGAILVARDGQIVISKGYGMADYGRGTPNTARTRFRLASLTKQFTATGIMLLKAQGKLNIQDSICRYLPDCPPAWQPVTVFHLLTHTSGIPNYTDFADYPDYEQLPATPAEIVSRFRGLPLNYAPGEVYYYANSGYVLLGMIIEQVTGMPYGDFIRTAIFEPLQMYNSGYDPGDGSIDRATGYAYGNTPAISINTSTLFSAGGLYSTVEDLFRWDQALYTDVLLPESLRAEMFTPYRYNYGLGWQIFDRDGRRVIAHPGFISGAATYIARYPDSRVTVIVLSNLESASVESITFHLASLVLP